jgi:hypothetical protein
MTSPLITIDLNAHSGTNDCGICNWVSGEYYLTACVDTAQNDVCGDPDHRWVPANCTGANTARWGYSSSINGFDFRRADELLCSVTGTTLSDFKKVTAGVTIYLDARTYCAYEKDGVIYDTNIEGSRLVGRAIEVRLKLSISIWYAGYGGCGFIKDPTFDREMQKFYGCLDLYNNSILYPDEYGVMVPGVSYGDSYDFCCVYDHPYDPYPLGDCTMYGAYDDLGYGANYADLVFVWRTINSLNHECAGQLETLRFVPEESYSYRYYEDGGSCQRHELCDAPGVITWET